MPDPTSQQSRQSAQTAGTNLPECPECRSTALTFHDDGSQEPWSCKVCGRTWTVPDWPSDDEVRAASRAFMLKHAGALKRLDDDNHLASCPVFRGRPCSCLEARLPACEDWCLLAKAGHTPHRGPCQRHIGKTLEGRQEGLQDKAERIVHRADERAIEAYNRRRDILRGTSPSGFPEDNERSDLLREGFQYGAAHGRAEGFAMRDRQDDLQAGGDIAWQDADIALVAKAATAVERARIERSLGPAVNYAIGALRVLGSNRADELEQAFADTFTEGEE